MSFPEPPSHDNPGGAADATVGVGRLPPGTVLRGRLSVDELVARTALGEVYRGTDVSDGKQVLVKLLTPELVREQAVRIRLQQDMAIAAQLQHKNVAATLGFFTEGEHVLLVSEPVDGPSLRQMLERKRQGGARGFTLKGAYNVVTHLCNALEYAHGALFHGALSLDTVFVNSAGRVKVTDFGLARAVASQPSFLAALGPARAAAAPEIAGGADRAGADRRADLFSVGAILFELLAGRPPTDESDHLSAVAAGVPPELDAVVARCLQPAPEDRFHDAHEVSSALHAATEAALAVPAIALAGGATGPDRRPPPPPPPGLRPPSLPPFRPPAPSPEALPRPLLVSPPDAARSPAAAAPSPAPRPSPAAPSPLPPPVAASFPGGPGSALSAVDEAHERWLIQRDKLDLGPFKLSEVKSQVQAGKILGEHTIVDMENGARTRVKDHPLLRELAAQAEGRLQSQRELEKIEADRRAARRRTTLLLSIAGAAVIAAAVPTTLWLMKQKPKVIRDTQIVHVKDDSPDDVFKIERITMKVDPPPPKRKPGAAHGGKGGKGSEFDAVTNLGDASQGGGDETLDESVVQRVMEANFRLLKGCVLDEKRRTPAMSQVEFDFLIKGSGQVTAVKANGSTDGPLASCIYAKMQAVQFPKFNGSRTHASFSLALK